MRKLTYLVACTVDGFIAAEDGSIDAFVNDKDYFADLFGFFPETCPGHLREALGVRGGNKHFDAVLMGRNTYLDVGATREEAVETVVFLTGYVGFPRVLNAMSAAKEVFAERDDEPHEDKEASDHMSNTNTLEEDRPKRESDQTRSTIAQRMAAVRRGGNGARPRAPLVGGKAPDVAFFPSHTSLSGGGCRTDRGSA